MFQLPYNSVYNAGILTSAAPRPIKNAAAAGLQGLSLKTSVAKKKSSSSESEGFLADDTPEKQIKSRYPHEDKISDKACSSDSDQD